jgi:hypothetical protein
MLRSLSIVLVEKRPNLTLAAWQCQPDHDGNGDPYKACQRTARMRLEALRFEDG